MPGEGGFNDIRVRLAAVEQGGNSAPAWGDVTGKPSSFPPDAHGHVIADVTGLQAALDAAAGSSALAGVAVAPIPSGKGVLEWVGTIAAAGVSIGKIVIVGISPATDDDENGAEWLSVSAMSADAGTDQIMVTLGFSEPTSGPVKLNWSAF